MIVWSVATIFIVGVIFVPANYAEKIWDSPDAWSRTPKGDCNSNNAIVVGFSEDPRVASVYYAKLLKFIFDRKKMKIEPPSDFYVRKIVFQATEEELNTIENSINPRELDEVVDKILLRIPESDQFVISNTIFSMLMFLLNNLNVLTSPEVKFTLIMISCIIIMFYIKKKYRYGLIFIMFIGSISFGFINAYYSCNKKLEIKRYLEELTSMENPCENIGSKSFFSNMFIRYNPEEECLKYLEKKHGIKFPYCHPGEVFMKYFNDVLFYQLFLFVEKGTELLSKCFVIFKFPYNYLAVVIAVLILPHIFNLQLKLLLGPFLKILKTERTERQTNRKSSIVGDRLTGENLNYFLKSLKYVEVKENKTSRENTLSKYTKFKSMSSPSLYDEAQ